MVSIRITYSKVENGKTLTDFILASLYAFLNIWCNTDRTYSWGRQVHFGMIFRFPGYKNKQFQEPKKIWILKIQKYLFNSVISNIYLLCMDYFLCPYHFSFYHLKCFLSKCFWVIKQSMIMEKFISLKVEPKNKVK